LVLSQRNIEYSKTADLPQLTKLLTKELELVPEAISDSKKGAEQIRKILGNLSAITQNLAELRGLYGTGHGRDGNYKGLAPRHARLAATSAIAFIEFIYETHRLKS
jgi:HEPN domain-containing protein